MTVMSGALSCTTLEVLFPGAEAADRERLLRAAAAVDAACISGQPVWQWFPGHPVFPGADGPGVSEILLAEIPLYDADSDWLGLEFTVEWTKDGELNACVAVGVQCLCEANHGTHYVDTLNVPVGGETPLGDAFEAAAAQLIGWLAGAHDPEWWRNQAPLPSPVVE
ncbi:hypothetical protein G6045_06050 [Streptomyces sp. YC504]|uniref:Uncharacterized protein n=1 Tax=Streptomyces mesophilus TaxID=1775132 RepID=A0A6G4XDC9_9ACTN|nr:hypothetical protein [Streptomyces mesophilus]NGO75243.1 hypothetical protein [Streptomyces mesophilus]